MTQQILVDHLNEQRKANTAYIAALGPTVVLDMVKEILSLGAQLEN